MNGHSIVDAQELVKTFNCHFASVGERKPVSYPMVIVVI